MADDNLEQWIKDAEGKPLTEVIINVSGKIQDLLEYKRSKGEKVSLPTCNTVKKALEFIWKKCSAISEQNSVLKARLEDRKEYNEKLAELAQKISRASVSSVEETQQITKPPMPRRKEEHTIVITPTDANQDMAELREKIKSVNKENRNLPRPRDIITTKENKMILKYGTREEAETIKDKLEDTGDIKQVAKINVPIRRRERVLILSVDPKIEEADIKQEVDGCLQTGTDDDPSGLQGKLRASDIDTATKRAIQSLLLGSRRESKIIRKIITKQGKHNWLLDVDEESKRILLEMKRICIDFDRYRVVNYISIMRCYRCQKYGHLANNCSEEPNCVKCAATDHVQKDCKSETECCSNCYFNDSGGECSHRADSNSCPVFQEYRNSLMANRS